MKNLFFVITAALAVGRSYCQLPSSTPVVPQEIQNNTSTNGNTTVVGLNTTPNATLNGQSSDGLNATSTSNTTSLDSTSELNPTAPSNTTVPLYSAPMTDNLNNTELISNSTVLSNSTSSGTFVMSQAIIWDNSNFTIYDEKGNASFLIVNQVAGLNMTKKEFVVQNAITGENKVKVDARTKLCGFGQTYEADDGTTFRLDTRAFLPDYWYINSNSTQYTYKRGALSMEGTIYENERIVAQVSVRKNSTSTSTYKKQLTLTTDGSIPSWDLIALLAIVKTRIQSCGY